MNPSLSFAKPAPIEMDAKELEDAARVMANWVGTQIEQANMPIQRFPSFVRAKKQTGEDGKAKPVLEVRWLDPAAGGAFVRVFTTPDGINVDACERIMRFVLNACRGGR